MRKEWVGKRQAVRTNVQLRAQMRFGPGQPPVDCTIMDISATGARIILSDEVEHPNDFDVFIPARSETKWARVRWREKRQIGIEFLKVKPDDREGLDASLLERLIRIEERLAAAPRDDGQAAPPGVDPEAAAAGAAEREARLAFIDSRLSDLELERAGAEPSGLGSDLADALTPLLDRVELLDARVSALSGEVVKAAAQSDAVQRRFDLLQTQAEGPSDAPRTTPEPSESLDQHDRLSALEASLCELKATVRTLILLTAAKINQAQG